MSETILHPTSGRWMMERGWVYGLPVLVVLGLLLTLAIERRNPDKAYKIRGPYGRPIAAVGAGEYGDNSTEAKLSDQERAEGFGAAKWGMKPQQAQKAMGGPLAYRQSYLMGQQVWLSYNYTHANQLYEIAAVFPSSPDKKLGRYSSLLKQRIQPALDAEYGAPKEIQNFNDQGEGTWRLLWVGEYSRVQTYLDIIEGNENLRVVFRSKSIHDAIEKQKEDADSAHRKKKSKVFAE